MNKTVLEFMSCQLNLDLLLFNRRVQISLFISMDLRRENERGGCTFE
jgi:hypothetical protein